MPNAEAMYEIAKSFGAGAAFLLTVACYVIWNAYREELKYSRERERETLTVLSTLTNSLKDISKDGTLRDDKILEATKNILHLIESLQSTILRHLEKRV